MIFFGHFSAQAPHPVHFSGSICAILSTTLTASNWHTFSHILHPIHPTEQTCITSFPLSFELHCTICLCSYGTSSISFLGHTSIHLPQAYKLPCLQQLPRLQHGLHRTDRPAHRTLLPDNRKHRPLVRFSASY